MVANPMQARIKVGHTSRMVGCAVMVNLTRTEMNRLLDQITDLRHRGFVMLGYMHGMRRGELLALRGQDIQNGHIRIVRLKQRNRPIVNVQPLHERERELVERLAGLAGPGRMFNWSASYASRIIKDYLTKAGVYTFARQKSLHSLRHSAGTNLYKHSKDIVAVSCWLGQRSIESSRRYTNISQDELEALAARAL
jgi:integrase